MTLGQLVAANPTLEYLASQRLSAKARYRIARLIGHIRRDVEHFHTEHVALIKELGLSRDPTPAERKTHGPGPLFEVQPEHLEVFHRRFLELQEVPISVTGQLTLADVEDVPLSANDILALGELLQEEPV